MVIFFISPILFLVVQLVFGKLHAYILLLKMVILLKMIATKVLYRIWKRPKNWRKNHVLIHQHSVVLLSFVEN
ncbi:unnamed protein product [Onchocerca flexuosa]|uniref:Secreted protein n=1 Tax=Onchocerca flexuosa TaxID=387005 RepID=A0A183HIV0_9BILA|nr:unnamed protein product [Onchocerca flexuosa]